MAARHQLGTLPARHLPMNLPSILLWGFAATVLLKSLTIAAQSLGLTRIDIPFIIGTMFTPDRDRAKVVGLMVHLVNGWIFAIVHLTSRRSPRPPRGSRTPLVQPAARCRTSILRSSTSGAMPWPRSRTSSAANRCGSASH
jgi:hypothetical protein